MHPADIQALLKKRGITQKEIARELGVSEVTVSQEVLGHPRSEKVRQAVAAAILRDPKEVFPGYYFSKRRRRISEKPK